MSAVGSSLGRTAQSLQQPLPELSRIYIEGLARSIEARGTGITEDDLWEAYARLGGVPRETIRVCYMNHLEDV